MRRLRSLGSLLVVSAVLLPACLVPPQEEDPPSPAPPSFPLSLTDDAGFTLELEEAPERVVALGDGVADMLDALEVEPLLLDADTPSGDQVRALNPDLVLEQAGPGPLGELERDPSIPIFILTTPTFEDLLHDVITIGRLTGKDAEAEDLVATMAERAGDVRERAEEAGPVTCFLERGPLERYSIDRQIIPTYPEGSFEHDLLLEAGCDPITRGSALRVAELIRLNPAVYLVEGPSSAVEEVAGRRDFVALAAVQVDRVHAVDPGLLNPGPAAADALVAIAGALYPESPDEEEDGESPTPTPTGSG